MDKGAKRRTSNTEKEHEEAVAVGDPTRVSQKDLEGLAKEAVKKFKSMG